MYGCAHCISPILSHCFLVFLHLLPLVLYFACKLLGAGPSLCSVFIQHLAQWSLVSWLGLLGGVVEVVIIMLILMKRYMIHLSSGTKYHCNCSWLHLFPSLKQSLPEKATVKTLSPVFQTCSANCTYSYYKCACKWPVRLLTSWLHWYQYTCAVMVHENQICGCTPTFEYQHHFSSQPFSYCDSTVQ